MNKSKIEWCDHTWNPVTGCRHGCPYCYARTMTARFAGDVRLNKMARADYQLVDAADESEEVYLLEKPMMNETGNALVYPFGFEPTYHRYRMDTLDKLKMGNNIFVGAMSDIFGAWVPGQWITDILGACMERPQHNYMFLTKNPKRYCDLEDAEKLPVRENMWYGTSVTNAAQMGIAVDAFGELQGKTKTFFSIEPILENIATSRGWAIASNCRYINWVILGAETGRRREKVVPDREWIEKIVLDCDMEGIPVFMKNSLIPIIGEENMRREFPLELQRRTVSKKMQNKLYAECSKCKAYQKKRNMVTLLARFKRGEQPKQYGFMCRDCFGKEYGDMGIDMSDLTEGNADG